MSRAAILLTALILLSSSIVSTSVLAEGNESRDPPTVKIGFLYDMTGPIAVYGPGFSAAANIAEDHINSMQSQYNFEIVYADSGCDGSVASYAAQSLINDGVVAVSGAACSGASMGANSMLSSYGIPQVSYASTSYALSDDSSYPGFMRVVPSDAAEGHALSYALNQTGDTYPAIVHIDNSAMGVAETFTDAYGSSNICSTLGYDDLDHTNDDDFSDEVYSLMSDGCDSVVMVSYSLDGAALVEELRDWGFSGSIVGAQGITAGSWLNEFDYPSEANGVHAVKPVYENPQTNLQTAFDYECNQDSDCSSGIYVREAYDSIRIIADAYINSSSYSSLEHAILGTGTNWEGASGYVTFLPNGDAVGHGYDICEWVSQSLSCTEVWTPGTSDSDGDGWTDADELDCSTDPNDSNSFPYDSDSDGMCNHMDVDDDNDGWSDTDESVNCGENNDPLNPLDSPTDTDSDQICDAIDDDDDNDGYLDANDWAPTDPNEWIDTDGDGTGDNADFDDDGDSWADIREIECGYDPLSASSTPPDFDSDNECDEIDYDDDNDGYPDNEDWAPLNPSEWVDTDDDGTGDNTDDDDDGDGYADDIDWAPLDWSEWLDTDGDNIGDNTDEDDDGDGYADDIDWAPLDGDETIDTDLDGTGDNADLDDDNDGYSDLDETTNCGISSDPLDESSIPVDFDSDLICDMLDEDVDNDGYLDTVDIFPYDPNEWYDNDMDGIGDNADPDDDGDGILDDSDALPLDPNEWQDRNNDGLGDNAYPLSIGEKISLHPIMLIGTLLIIFGGIGGAIFMSSKKKGETPPLYQDDNISEYDDISEQTSETVFSKKPSLPPGIIIPSGSHKVSSWEELPPGGDYIQNEPMEYVDEEGRIWVRQHDDSWVMQ